MEAKRIFFKEKKILITIFLIVFACLQINAQLAKDKCKFLGNVIANAVPGNFSTYWNQITPENAGKWGSAEPTRDNPNWSGLDIAYNEAKAKGIPFKQHTFVWGQQQPNWIGALPAEEQKEEVEEWIKSYSERYPETDFIDVVNEPLHAVPNYSTALGGGGTTGWDWVIWAFEKTRQYSPNAKLILNDYNIINNDGATNSYLTIINLLKARNLIDGIGIQCHRFEVESAPIDQLKTNLDKLAATGLPIYISEFDLGNINDTSSGNSTTDDNIQLDFYKKVFPVLWSHPAVHGITIWGYQQGQTWQVTSYLVHSNGTERPALTWLKTYVASAFGGSFCLPPVGVEEDETTGKVYPIPAVNGRFTLELGAGKFKVAIFDMQGRIKKELTVSDDQPVEVHVEGASGIYLLKVSDGHHTTVEKIIFD